MKYLSELMQDEQTKLFNETGGFFAFGQKQFDEKVKKGVKYVDLGSGLICPKKTAKILIDGLEEIAAKAIKNHFTEYGAKKIISQAYFNHESQISMCTENAKDSLLSYIEQYPKEFSDEIINEEFKKCFNLAVENDWF